MSEVSIFRVLEDGAGGASFLTGSGALTSGFCSGYCATLGLAAGAATGAFSTFGAG
jgi:hypothetical protein